MLSALSYEIILVPNSPKCIEIQLFSVGHKIIYIIYLIFKIEYITYKYIA